MSVGFPPKTFGDSAFKRKAGRRRYSPEGESLFEAGLKCHLTNGWTGQKEEEVEARRKWPKQH